MVKTIEKHWYIPENLDIEDLLKENPLPEGSAIKREHLLYIIHLITSIPATKKNLETKNGFVPINAALLQEKVKDYSKCLNFLIKAGVLLKNNRYIPGETSKGYKFTPKYNTVVKQITVHLKDTLAWRKKKDKRQQAIVKKYKHLFQWYNGELQINAPLALKYIEYDLEMKLQNEELRDIDRKTGKTKDPKTQYNYSLINIERTEAHDFRLSVDNNIYRLHSVLSNIRSSLRNFITYQGEQLISVDLKNSQPYISAILLKEEFWKDSYTLYNIKDIIPPITSSTMLGKVIKMQASTDFQEYRHLVSSGKLYEKFAELVKSKIGKVYTSRREIKEDFFKVIYTDNHFLGQPEAAPKRVFKERFPNVYELFRAIKQNKKEDLSRLLQRIESHLILQVITKRISKERPSLPIFTIHDNVITMAGNDGYVQSVMLEELEKATGIRPSLSVEYWKPENVNM